MRTIRVDPQTVAYRFLYDGSKLYAWVRPTYILVDFRGRQYRLSPRPLMPGLDTMEWIKQGINRETEITASEFITTLNSR